MHIEVLTEDSSGKALLEHLLPKLIGPLNEPHYRRIIDSGGVGRIPPGMRDGDPKKRTLLNKLPAMLRSYGRQENIDAVIVVLDADKNDCGALLAELQSLAEACGAGGKTMFRLAIEETEAWYFGDPDALHAAYPKARKAALKRYRQDRVCRTWEMLADAVHPAGLAALSKPGSPRPGDLKHEWANRIGPLMNPYANRSPSFGKLRDGLRRLIAASAIQPGQTPAG
nr:DUF4276 family protein [uncultured Rhodopila sp.]